MPAEGVTPRAGRREWIGLAVLALPCMLYAMDLTVLNLAVPQLSSDLRPTSSQLLWIIDIYGFMVAGSLITMGTLGDRIGRRKLLLLGALAFGIASVVAAFSRSAPMLIAARALLGIAGATVAPSTLSLIRNMFVDPKQRTIAISMWITSYSVGGAIGPLLGGVVLEHFRWGAVFLISVPVMLLLLLLGPWLLPEYRDPHPGPLDIVSAAMSLSAILLVIFGLKRMAERGVEWLPIVTIVVGVVAGILFLRRQRTLEHPLIDLQLFRGRTFGAAISLYMMATFVAFAVYMFIAQYLQLVLGMSPLQAGLWTLPWSAGFICGAQLVPVFARRFAPAFVIGGGLIIGAVGFALLTQLDHGHGLAIIVAGSIIFSVGLSPAFTLTTDIVMTSAPPERAGAAAAISETSSELGGVLGIAIMGSIGTVIYRGAMTRTPEAARGTLGGALAIAEGLSKDGAAVLTRMARAAFVQSMQVTSMIETALVVIMAVAAFIALRPTTSDRSHPRAPRA